VIIPTALFLVGGVLVYAAVKDIDPRTVIMNIMAGRDPDASEDERSSAEKQRDLKDLLDPRSPGQEGRGPESDDFPGFPGASAGPVASV